MMQTNQITCDNCHGDLSNGSTRSSERLVLRAEQVWTEPLELKKFSINEPRHFCNLRCLDTWLMTEVVRADSVEEVKDE